MAGEGVSLSQSWTFDLAAADTCTENYWRMPVICTWRSVQPFLADRCVRRAGEQRRSASVRNVRVGSFLGHKVRYAYWNSATQCFGSL